MRVVFDIIAIDGKAAAIRRREIGRYGETTKDELVIADSRLDRIAKIGSKFRYHQIAGAKTND